MSHSTESLHVIASSWSRLSCSVALGLAVFAASPALAQDEGRTLVDLKLEGRPLNEVLKELGANYGLNYVVSGDALEKAGAVHCRLERVELANAIQMLCAACNLQAQINGLYVVIRIPQAGEAPKFSLPSLEEARREAEPRKPGVESVFNPESGRGGEDRRDPARGRPSSGAPAPRPTPVAAEPEEVVATGLIIKIEAAALTLKLDGGETLLLQLPQPGEMETMVRVQLAQAVERTKVGHRVSAIYNQVGTRNLLQSLVVGRDPRDNSTTRLPDDFRPDEEE